MEEYFLDLSSILITLTASYMDVQTDENPAGSSGWEERKVQLEIEKLELETAELGKRKMV